MNLVKFLLRASWRITLFATLAGLLSGASISGLIALINVTLNTSAPRSITLIFSFVVLMAGMLCFTIISEVLLIHLSEGATLKLRLELSRRILAVPMRQLEQIGPHRLLAALTSDVSTIVNTPELDAQAQDYLVRLQLDHKVQVNQGVLSTTALSQGQRKRLALLTAYLEDRPFYVFDEWAADQDPFFKDFFILNSCRNSSGEARRFWSLPMTTSIFI